MKYTWRSGACSGTGAGFLSL